MRFLTQTVITMTVRPQGFPEATHWLEKQTMHVSSVDIGTPLPGTKRGAAGRAVDEMLASVAWYRGLPVLERGLVHAELRTLTLRAGEYLFQPGASSRGWYGVVDGMVKWSARGADGRSLSIAGLGAGNWFGEAAMVCHANFEYEVIALRTTRIVILPRETCERLWNNNIEFTKALMNHLAQRVNWLMGRYTGNVLLDVDTTVAQMILAQLAADQSASENGRLRISQEEIACLCGISRQRCNAAIVRLVRMGILTTHYGGLTVTDIGGLRRLAAQPGTIKENATSD
jgi:CRP/FNR family cyclic AMP-dependent transcriptional regulator